MAFIERFEARLLTPKRVHAPVTCGHSEVVAQGKRLLQLETYGSADRQMPDKVSQVLQLDEAGARELKRIIENAFPGI